MQSTASPLATLFRVASASSQFVAFYMLHLGGLLTFDFVSKMFTLWTGVMLTLYLLMALLNDWIKSPSSKQFFDRAVSLAFHLSLVMSIATVSMFWSIYALDSENFIPKGFYFPPLLNHLQHTAPGVIVLAELFLIRTPDDILDSYWGSKLAAVCLTPVAYLSFTALNFYVKGSWPYPFMSSWTVVEFGVFFVVGMVLAVLFHWCVYWLVKKFGSKRTEKLE